VAEQAAPAQVSHLHSAPAPLLHEPPAFSEAAVPESASDYFQEMLFLRQQFGLEDNCLLSKTSPDRGAVNTEQCKQLLEKIKAKKAPRSINVEENKETHPPDGYDTALFKERLEIGGAVEVRKLDAPARGHGRAILPRKESQLQRMQEPGGRWRGNWGRGKEHDP